MPLNEPSDTREFERTLGCSSLARSIADKLLADAPGCWEDARGGFALPEDTSAVLDGLARAWRRGEHDVVPRVFSGGAPIGFHPDRHLPAPCEALEDFLARLARERRGPDTGVVIEDAPSFAPALFLRVQRFLVELYEAMGGMPPGGAHSELFLGDYDASFFSVHKDSLHTVTSVLHGRKRFLLWPSESMEALPELAGTRHTQATLPAALDTPALRASALQLEGGPGAVFFWPASWWHLAEKVPGADFAVTITVATSPVVSKAPGACFRQMSRALEDLFDEGWAPRPGALPWAADGDPPAARAARRMQALVDDLGSRSEVRAAFAERILGWVSAGGFERVPAPREPTAFSPEDVVIAPAGGRLTWLRRRPDDGGGPDAPLTVAVNGLILEATAAYVPLLQRLNAGFSGAASALVGIAGGALDEVEVLEALGALYAARAIERGGRQR